MKTFFNDKYPRFIKCCGVEPEDMGVYVRCPECLNTAEVDKAEQWNNRIILLTLSIINLLDAETYQIAKDVHERLAESTSEISLNYRDLLEVLLRDYEESV